MLPRDARHRDALDTAARGGPEQRLLTTNLVLGETWTFLRSRDGHDTAVRFLDRIGRIRSTRTLTVHTVIADEESRAWRWLRRHDERPYSFVDAASFEVMRARRLREALAFDDDFAAAGFIEVRP